ncbi:MAG: leucyl aminopeptidase [Desulfobacterales bacterium]|nr:leucyl aminopeptidase [Desulfobacterales bacterium]
MLKLTSQRLPQLKTETLVVPLCEDRVLFREASLVRLIEKTKGIRTFTARAGELLDLYQPEGLQTQRIVFAGLGSSLDLTAEGLRQAAGKSIRHAWHAQPGQAVLAVPDTNLPDVLRPERALAAMAEGAYLANHTLTAYKSVTKTVPLKSIRFMVAGAKDRNLRPILARIEKIARGTTLARDWVNLPANAKTPRELARLISRAARQAGVTATLMDATQLKRLKMGALLAVGAGSSHPPKMLILDHKPPRSRETLVLVGKGVTFDAGGLNLKPTGSIEMMKIDMAGAAAVGAAVVAAAELGLKKRVVGVLPMVENMVSGAAFRPGDIVRSYSGQTIEIGNTDAEGRLILADALSYAVKRYKPKHIIDLATLTGACVVALGDRIAGLFSADAPLRDQILQSSEETHERCWSMPLPEDYKDLLKSDLADMRNIGPGRWGGAIVAALFLSRFVGDTPWAHIDIAGPAYTKKAQAYTEAGGTGFGVRLLCDLMERL